MSGLLAIVAQQRDPESDVFTGWEPATTAEAMALQELARLQDAVVGVHGSVDEKLAHLLYAVERAYDKGNLDMHLEDVFGEYASARDAVVFGE